MNGKALGKYLQEQKTLPEVMKEIIPDLIELWQPGNAILLRSDPHHGPSLLFTLMTNYFTTKDIPYYLVYHSSKQFWQDENPQVLLFDGADHQTFDDVLDLKCQYPWSTLLFTSTVDPPCKPYVQLLKTPSAEHFCKELKDYV